MNFINGASRNENNRKIKTESMNEARNLIFIFGIFVYVLVDSDFSSEITAGTFLADLALDDLTLGLLAAG